MPARIFWAGDRPLIEWRRIHRSMLGKPFWWHIVDRGQIVALTPLDESTAELSDLRIAGGIHHIWRCGSTLLCRQFSALPDTFAISEPFVFDHLIHHPASDPALLPRRIRQMAATFRDALAPIASRLVIKWAGGLTRHAAILHDALPEVPTIFLHRDPIEVLQSMRERTIGMPDGFDEPDPAALLETLATIIAAGCRAVAGVPSIRTVDYIELPAAAARSVAPWFGYAPVAEYIAAMDAAAGADAKASGARPFVADGAAKRAAADDEVRRLAGTVVAPALAEALAALAPLRR